MQIGELGHVGVALAFGLVIAVMIYALGHMSGAPFNPAVSVGFAVGRHFRWPLVGTYVAAQILGAIDGALFLRITLGPEAVLGVTPIRLAPTSSRWYGRAFSRTSWSS